MNLGSGATTSAEVDLEQQWDVVIVGTGMGGATVGRALARQGFSVLFLEKGGRIGATQNQSEPLTPEDRLARGWWPHPMSQRRADGNCDRFFASVGCAVGGSSIHYAGALGRMKRSDFDPLVTPKLNLPAWAASFDEFVPHYEAAEAAFGVRAAALPEDELRLSEWGRGLLNAMRKNGIKPEVLRVAMRYDEKCEECTGRICPRSCKADARTACLEDALRQPRSGLLDYCDVQSIDADAKRVRCVRAIHRGRQIEVRGRIVVLAAGAMHSPVVLLRSTNEHWPRGLANSSDQVGRNLMFHTADIYGIWGPRKLSRQGRQKKAMEVRDFHVYNGKRLGYAQSMGLDAGQGHIAMELKGMLRRQGLKNELLLSLLVKLPSHIASWFLGAASIFAANTEDDPDPNNRIQLDPNEPNGASFTYTITDDLRERAIELRETIARHMKPWRLMSLSPVLTMNHGHPCGTCRFGNDPATNVLDRDCKAHDLENLYVVDASFMPRSGAINPSLTIAANALRVAPRIAAALGAPSVGGTAPPIPIKSIAG